MYTTLSSAKGHPNDPEVYDELIVPNQSLVQEAITGPGNLRSGLAYRLYSMREQIALSASPNIPRPKEYHPWVIFIASDRSNIVLAICPNNGELAQGQMSNRLL
jgi:hypothetical protein